MEGVRTRVVLVRLERLIVAQRRLVSLFLAVVVPSVVIFLIGQFDSAFDQFAKTSLKAAWSTPWGFFTYIFVHKNFEHLAANIVLFAVALVMFALTEMLLEEGERKRREGFLIGSVLAIAVIAILLVSLLEPTSSAVGASGVVYAAIGVAAGFALLNVMAFAFHGRKVTGFFRGALFVTTANLGVFLLLVVWAFNWGFLGAAEGVNLPGHILAFGGGLIAALVYELGRGLGRRTRTRRGHCSSSPSE